MHAFYSVLDPDSEIASARKTQRQHTDARVRALFLKID